MNNSHDRLDADRGGIDKPNLLLVSNDPWKPYTVRLIEEHYLFIQGFYGEVAATTGTARSVQHLLPLIRDLGHGPDWGDIKAIWYCLEHTALGRRVHAMVFLSEEVEKHQIFKIALASSLLKLNTCWLPTPATAAEFLSAIQALWHVEQFR